jgi:hypothetical protein
MLLAVTMRDQEYRYRMLQALSGISHGVHRKKSQVAQPALIRLQKYLHALFLFLWETLMAFSPRTRKLTDIALPHGIASVMELGTSPSGQLRGAHGSVHILGAVVSSVANHPITSYPVAAASTHFLFVFFKGKNRGFGGLPNALNLELKNLRLLEFALLVASWRGRVALQSEEFPFSTALCLLCARACCGVS